MQVLFFDGECVLCNSTAHRVAKLNTQQNIHFASLQGKLSLEKLKALPHNIDSIVFLDKDRIYIKSEAVFEILKYLPSLKWLRIFRIFPLTLRDLIYDFVARNRLKWFGKQDLCEVPPKEFRGRYIAD
jgi:predicted DCC family thiol-disulfide oxidoreductase YuxK